MGGHQLGRERPPQYIPTGCLTPSWAEVEDRKPLAAGSSGGAPGEEGKGAFVVGVVFEGHFDGLAADRLVVALPGGG